MYNKEIHDPIFLISSFPAGAIAINTLFFLFQRFTDSSDFVPGAVIFALMILIILLILHIVISDLDSLRRQNIDSTFFNAILIGVVILTVFIVHESSLNVYLLPFFTASPILGVTYMAIAGLWLLAYVIQNPGTCPPHLLHPQNLEILAGSYPRNHTAIRTIIRSATRTYRVALGSLLAIFLVALGLVSLRLAGIERFLLVITVGVMAVFLFTFIYTSLRKVEYLVTHGHLLGGRMAIVCRWAAESARIR